MSLRQFAIISHAHPQCAQLFAAAHSHSLHYTAQYSRRPEKITVSLEKWHSYLQHHRSPAVLTGVIMHRNYVDTDLRSLSVVRIVLAILLRLAPAWRPHQ